MSIHRIRAKLFVKDPASVDLSGLVPGFHRWIQTNAVDDVLVDVADYKHVHEGPGILLIGHEGDFALDAGRGRPGLQYTRKRGLSSALSEAVRQVLYRLIHAAHLLETDASLYERYAFRTDELEISFLDRLRIPNRPESLALIHTPLKEVLTAVFEGVDVELSWIEDDAREPFSVHVRAPGAPGVETLLERLVAQHA